jgi:hypothetical protein
MGGLIERIALASLIRRILASRAGCAVTYPLAAEDSCQSEKTSE